MKNALYCTTALLVLALLPTSASAQRSGRSHESGIRSSRNHDSDKSKNTAKDTDSSKVAKQNRSNKGGAVRGKARAEQVQSLNNKADTNRGFTIAPGVEKAETKTAGNNSHAGKE